jgi:hypothetical protein
LLKKA